MAKFILTYLGGNPPSSPAAGKEHFAKYQAWLGSLRDSAVSPMNPFKETSTVGPDGSVTSGSSTAMSGYTILEAESMTQALEMARSCPFLDIGGSLEVSQLMEMPG